MTNKNSKLGIKIRDVSDVPLWVFGEDLVLKDMSGRRIGAIENKEDAMRIVAFPVLCLTLATLVYLHKKTGKDKDVVSCAEKMLLDLGIKI